MIPFRFRSALPRKSVRPASPSVAGTATQKSKHEAEPRFRPCAGSATHEARRKTCATHVTDARVMSPRRVGGLCPAESAAYSQLAYGMRPS